MIAENGRRLVDSAAGLLRILDRDPQTVVEASTILGRNLNGVLTFDDGERIFVKQIGGLGAPRRHARSVSFHTAVCSEEAGSDLRTPALRADEAETCTLAYEYIDAASTFAESIRELEANDADVRQAGRSVAALHSLTITDAARLDDSRPMFPPNGPNAMSRDTFYGSTMGQLDMWRYIQRDAPLLVSLNALVRASEQCRRAPAHGDLRADQLFLTDDEAWMFDWEEFRLGDPARDVGAMLGEVFYHRLRRTIVDASLAGEDLDDATVIRFGGDAIDQSRPLANTLWSGYMERVDPDVVDDTFVDRAVGYFGWQLFDRSLASGTYFGRVSALDRALAGIGREAIVGAERYGAVLGLTQEEAAA